MTNTPHAGATRYAGSRVQRVEDPRLLTGHGTFVDDIQLPGHAARVLRPQSARASADRRHRHVRGRRTRRCACRLRRRGPQPRGARAVVHVARSGVPNDTPRPPLAEGEVRFVGDPVALGAGGGPLRRRGRRRSGRGRLRAPDRGRRLPRRRRSARARARRLRQQPHRGHGRRAGSGGRGGVRRGRPRRHLDGGPAGAVRVPDGDARHRRRPQPRERRDHHLRGDAGAARGAGLRVAAARSAGAPDPRHHARHGWWFRSEDHGHARGDVHHARGTEGVRRR